MNTRTITLIVALLILLPSIKTYGTGHPNLFLTPQGVNKIKSNMGQLPSFDNAVAELKSIADAALKSEIIVPIPKDGGGGYSHEKHKSNYYEMNAAGTLYQISGEAKYAQFVRNMLMKYADIYSTLPLHPAAKSESAGKLFWQTLNDAVWLVHTANAYDCVYNYISQKDKNYIEKQLFHPMADFLSDGNPKNYATFNRMHNHGTWAEAAVGMIGYVMHDKNLVDKALYGSSKDGKTGFIKQLDVLFSPDGYFTEGPYYQRYAIWPFMTFAQAIENNQPELHIFKYRDGILLKAVNSLIQSSYDGEIFFLNDALPKTFQSQELVYAIDIAYLNNPTNKQLLDIARQQESYIVSDAGLETAKAVKNMQNQPFVYQSLLLRDGEKGDEGGISIFRTGETCMTLKATSHGLSHGHYDKLSIALYDNGNSILADYGAVRFLNIEPKNGGGYTKENYTWGSQTIAHNTVTIDEESNFNANIKESSKFHSEINYFDVNKNDIQVVSAKENNAYHGSEMRRTSALVKAKSFEYPIVIDIFNVASDSIHTLDLPFYYKGHLISTSFDLHRNTSMIKALGTKNGYQHLWLEASSKTEQPNSCFTWLNANRFYSITTLTDKNSELLLTRVGAGDPDFNLRNETCFMIRQTKQTNHTFVSIIEPHGLYDLTREVTSRYESNVVNLELIQDDKNFSVVKITAKDGDSYIFITVNSNFSDSLKRTIMLNGKNISFTGNYYFSEIQTKKL